MAAKKKEVLTVSERSFLRALLKKQLRSDEVALIDAEFKSVGHISGNALTLAKKRVKTIPKIIEKLTK